MTSNSGISPIPLRHSAQFLTTRWSVVISAGGSKTTHARDALEQLCQTYWYPLYAYARRKGYSSHDAQDLTQGFLARLLELNSLATVSPGQGRFRSFLLASMNHFISDEWDRARARKRGAGKVVPLDAESAETRYRLEPADEVSPETVYERQWALTLLQKVAGQLRQEYEVSSKGGLFEQLSFCLTGERSTVPYQDLAKQLKMSHAAIRVTVHRLRQRYRQLLRAEIAHTVVNGEDVEEELRYLFRVLAS